MPKCYVLSAYWFVWSRKTISKWRHLSILPWYIHLYLLRARFSAVKTISLASSVSTKLAPNILSSAKTVIASAEKIMTTVLSCSPIPFVKTSLLKLFQLRPLKTLSITLLNRSLKKCPISEILFFLPAHKGFNCAVFHNHKKSSFMHSSKQMALWYLAQNYGKSSKTSSRTNPFAQKWINPSQEFKSLQTSLH